MNFIKTTLLGGFLVLFPLLLLFLALSEIAGLLVSMAEPIADLFPADAFAKVSLPGVVATVLIVVASFAVGILMKSSWMRGVGNSLERSILCRIPMYKMLKTISAAFTNTDSTAFRPALVKSHDGGGEPCYVAEVHDNGMATVLLPWSPASFAGSVRIVRASDLQELDCSLDEFSMALSHMGVGVESCLARDRHSAQT